LILIACACAVFGALMGFLPVVRQLWLRFALASLAGAVLGWIISTGTRGSGSATFAQGATFHVLAVVGFAALQTVRESARPVWLRVILAGGAFAVVGLAFANA
jgi:hypothetical protein